MKYKHCCRLRSHTPAKRQVAEKKKLPQLLQRGLHHYQQGQLVAATRCLQHAVSLAPCDADIHYNLGVVLTESHFVEEGMAHYQRAIELNPTYVQAYNNLGNNLRKMGQISEAEKCFRRALQLAPNSSLVYNNLGNLKHPVNAKQAATYFRKAISLQPDYAEAHSNLLVTLNYLPELGPKQRLQEHLRFSRAHEHQIDEKPQPKFKQLSVRKKLRVAYVSPDFRQHPVAHFVAPVLAHHDRTTFEILAYYNHPLKDHWTRRLQSYADHWRDIARMTDSEVATMIQADRVDILVDLSGHTARNRLLVFARRPAPVQVSWLGYPCTTGLSAMDFYLTDKIADTEEDQQYYTEQLIFLKRGFSCYAPPDNAPDVGLSPARANGRVTFGSLNILSKINDAVLDLWSRLLLENPDSTLLILRNQLQGDVARMLIHSFANRGIDPSRLDLRTTMGSGKSHLLAYNAIDILLDTFPWNGHTTTCEALWMGVPVVTLYGQEHASRLCASILNQLGLTECIADSEEGYVRLATTLGSDLDRLASLRSTLRERMGTSPLCDGAAFTRNLERAYQAMWEAKAMQGNR